MDIILVMHIESIHQDYTPIIASTAAFLSLILRTVPEYHVHWKDLRISKIAEQAITATV